MRGGRPPKATSEEIIAAYLKYNSLTKVCQSLHSGSDRVGKILEGAGILLKRRVDYMTERKPPEHYIVAIYDYQRGVPTNVLKKTYGVSMPQLYLWMDKMGVTRRMRRTREWYCWECGIELTQGELFCCERHRRDYGSAAIRAGFVPPIHHRRENLSAEASGAGTPSDDGDQPGHRHFDGDLSGAGSAEKS